ncbi:hypothetical protein BUALT_Bualt08G0095200 [Buddleja alternifolia]|uniref:MaoC-like domain-containing protein n=1 Tax=Buddleja alternifolia TaxID=168488 RepID=A0AAV6X6K8_9LAMI|nr:hypothetical protein BUALT_Bualt08G0095200 [Buddleja alternifolia]
MAAKPAFDPQLIISHEFPQSTYTYTERDAALYALGIGACSKDAVDDKELKYVYHEDGQQSIEVLPTFAALFSNGLMSSLAEIQGFEFDPRLLLHGQQHIEIYKPLPSNGCVRLLITLVLDCPPSAYSFIVFSASLTCSVFISTLLMQLVNKASVAGLHDKGKAAVIEIEILSYEKESGVLLCMNRSAVYLRGAGGFSQSSQPYSYTKYPSNQTVAYKIPKSQPFSVVEECTQPAQALLYRLSGDYNPLHSDPMIAETAGFSRPILHGLCTLGFAVRAIIKNICRGDQNMIKNISGRFLLHVYPGETLITEMWLDGLRVLYQVKVKERNRAVLSGVVTLNRLSSSL